MKVNAITIRPGNVLEYENKLMLVTKIDLIQPGKGNAVIQVEMKDIRTGTKDQQPLAHPGDRGARPAGRGGDAVSSSTRATA